MLCYNVSKIYNTHIEGMMQTLRLMGLITLGTLLTACGGGGSSSEPSGQTPPNPEPSQGYLAVVSQDNERAALSLYDLNQHKTIVNTALKQLPLATYSSPSYGYAVLMDRVTGEVSFASAAQGGLLNYRLYGAAPTHYRDFNGQAAVFYDGNDSESSKFDVFTDQDIANGSVSSQRLPYKHHGVAEPRGELVLSSYLPEGAEQLSMVKSYLQHGNHYHVEQTLTQPCLGLHGAASNQNFTAFGCQDGVLLVEQKGQSFIDSKIPTDARIGTLLGHEKVQDLVAIASTQQDLLIVDPRNQQADWVAWTTQDTVKRLKQSFSASGQYFVILDDQGRLHILDSTTWQVIKILPIFTSDSSAIAQAQLAMHGKLDQLFINDAVQQSIYQIDLTQGKITQTIQLNTTPQQLAWLK